MIVDYNRDAAIKLFGRWLVVGVGTYSQLDNRTMTTAKSGRGDYYMILAKWGRMVSVQLSKPFTPEEIAAAHEEAQGWRGLFEEKLP